MNKPFPRYNDTLKLVLAIFIFAEVDSTNGLETYGDCEII